MPGVRSLLTQVRQDPSTKLFVSGVSTIPTDIQDGGDGAPPTQGEGYLVPDAVYTPHTLYIRRLIGQPLPDVRIGDSLVNPADRDPITYGPATYLISFVRRWSNHLEASARKPVQPANLAALNAQTLATWQQSATWLQKITQHTPSASRTAGYDPASHQVMARSDGAYGVGWQAPDTKSVVHQGYLPQGSIAVGIVDRVKMESVSDVGLVTFEEWALAYYMPPAQLAKGDVLVLPAPDNRRFVVADDLTPTPVYGIDVLRKATLEARPADDPIYNLPLT